MKYSIILVVAAYCLAVTDSFAESVNQTEKTHSNQGISEKTVWHTSLAEAKAESVRRKVPILADFSGSDWCGWCIKLEKEVFSTEVFRKYASENLVLLLVDFPRSKPQPDEIKKQNNELAEKFGIQGFPTVVLLDAEGKKLGQTSYLPGGGDNYVMHLRKLLKNK